MLVMTAVAAGCGSSGGDDTDTEVEPAPERPPLSTSAVPTTSGGTTVPATNLTLRLTDVRVVNSEESDSGMRVMLPAGVVPELAPVRQPQPASSAGSIAWPHRIASSGHDGSPRRR